MPSPTDYVHDAVMHIKKAIACFENPIFEDHEYHLKDAIHDLEIYDDFHDRKYQTIREILKSEVKNSEHIGTLRRIIDQLHESINYTPPVQNPNQLKIDFNGEQNSNIHDKLSGVKKGDCPGGERGSGKCTGACM